MTEDDTFNKLKRIPIEKMYKLLIYSPTAVFRNDDTFEEFLNQYHWTETEYTREFRKWINNK
jgi:hypothetical protein